MTAKLRNFVGFRKCIFSTSNTTNLQILLGKTYFCSMKTNQKSAAIGFIFITLLIDITGWGIVIPVVPKLIEELINADISEAVKSIN